LKAGARIAFDRAAEAVGHALPRTIEQTCHPERIEALLTLGAPAGGRALPRVERASFGGEVFESSNCSNFLVDVGFEGEDAGRWPRTLYAKLPCAEFATRAFANAVGFWETEAYFCAQLAHRLPVRVPRVYAAARTGSRFVLLLENLHEDESVRMFINRDMAAGTDPARSARCLAALARLHAEFEGLTPQEREAIFPARLHTYLAPGGAARSRVLNAAAIGPAHQRAPDLFRSADVALCRRAIEKWDALMEAWYGGALTLIHGDSHLANCFEYEAAGETRVGLIDFQGLQWCGALRDVQYHLANSLEPGVLAEAEDELLDGYLEALRRAGGAVDAEVARAQYRAYSFQTLMVAVVSLGLGSLTEREETVRTVLRRSVASVERLGFGDWLASL